MSPELHELLEKAKGYKWTYEAKLEQQISWVYGMQKMSGPIRTKEEIKQSMIDNCDIPDLDAIRATARQEGVNEGLEMADAVVTKHYDCAVRFNDVRTAITRAMYEIRALKTAPTTGGES